MARIVQRQFQVASGGSGSDRLVGDEYRAMRTDLVDPTGAYGFGLAPSGGGMTATRMPNGGPANRPYIHCVMVADAEGTGGDWNSQSSNGTLYGQSIFVRFSFRQGPANGTQKLIIINPELSPNSRPIMVIQNWGPANVGFVFRLCINGGNNIQDDGGSPNPDGSWNDGPLYHALNTWFNVQCEIRYPTDASSSNGYYKIWTNNDNYDSPTSQTFAALPLRNANNTDDFVFSGYQQTPGIFAGRTWDHADLRIGPTFDSNWHASGS